MLAPQSMRRLTRELAKLQKNAPDGIAVQMGEQDMLDVDGWIQGPAGTPYAGGFFRVHFDFQGSSFPASPPRCTMRTKIFHPNIHSNGEICVSTLKKDWNAAYGVEHILVVIKCLLISPNPDSALDPEAARLLQEEYEQYATIASMWTRIHASVRPVCMLDDDTKDEEEQHELGKPDGSPSFTKKMDVEDQSGNVSSAETTNSSSFAPPTAQPLTRSGSTNLNLHKKASFTLPTQQAAGDITNGNRRLSSASTLTKLTNGTNTAALQLGSALLETGLGGAAAAAAAATSAAVTAMVTAEMNRISLHGPIGGVNAASTSRESAAGMTIAGSMTWPTRRKQATMVRRGIKRL